MGENETQIVDFEISIEALVNSKIIGRELENIGSIKQRRKRLKIDLYNSLNGDVSERTLDKICHTYQKKSGINLGYPEEVEKYPCFLGDLKQVFSVRKYIRTRNF